MDETENKEAIHAACREGRLAAVESLLSANPKLAHRRDSDDRLPIHWACSYNHLPIVQVLTQVKDFDIDAVDASGWSCLMIACSVKDGDDLVEYLLKRGADAGLKNNNGQTPLHFCASKTRLSTAHLLLSPPYKASPRIPDTHSQLPLHRAAAVGSLPMVKLLLDHNSPLNSSDRSGFTALHHAIAEGHGDVAIELLRRGADSSRRDSDGTLAIALAPDRKVRTWILAEAEKEGVEVVTA
ncbi:uncharacterized protein H6S33_007332 [Morchella sextelata]|uniref:uncharacterized protein n=1 Tax=Morchella sextelata TaxID=1174677 RepID=UPI001D04ABF1|nr:uncharacterized protein H6S33_007332 [Morchella sextelata]KAH0603673.1 hypothetical protein H6S33_007332 [Morchella sextelata]